MSAIDHPADENPRPRWRTNPFVIGALLFVFVILAYLPVLKCGFVTFDDDTYVYNNVHVQHGLDAASVGWAFSTRLNGSWHPLTWLSILLDCQLFGMRAAGHHFTNVLIHGITTVLVFALFLRMTGAPFRSAFVAAIFGLHPLHVESVAWVSERKDVLCAFFWMLSLLMYVVYAERRTSANSGAAPGQRRSPWLLYALCLFFFLCGLMSKPMIVTLPFLLLLMDWWPLGRFGRVGISADGQASSGSPSCLLIEKIPFLLLAALCGLITLSGQRAAGAMMKPSDAPLAARTFNAILSSGIYLRQMLWPAGLAVYYPYPKFVNPWKVAAAGLVLLTVSGLVFSTVRRRPALTFGWVWFGVTLLPVIGLIQVGGQAHADRYMYVPSIGLAVMAAWLMADASQATRGGAIISASLAGAVIVGCFLLTLRQVTFWTDSESLYRRALAVTRDNAVAENNLGDVLLGLGRFEEAIQYCQTAAKLNSSFPDPHYNIGEALAAQGHLDEAILQYQQALDRFGGDADIHERFGRLLSLKGRTQDAIAQFEQALNLNPDHPQAHCQFGITLLKLQRVDEAVPHLRQAASLMPGYVAAHSNLGAALGLQGNFEEAVGELRVASRLAPLNPIAHSNLADALAAQGRLDEAAAQYLEALRLAPRDGVSHRNLALVVGKQGRLEEAVAQLTQAVNLMPNDARSRTELGIALGRQGKIDDAIEQFREALNTDTNNVEALCNLGVALGAKGQLDAAISYLQTALALRPDYSNAVTNLRLAQALKARSENTPP